MALLRLPAPIVGRLALVAVLLNWPWEMAQMSAYAEMAGRPWASTIWRCLRASAGDAALTVFAASLGLRISRQPPWAYAAAAAAGAMTALLVEWTAVSVGAWSYNQRMPTVPLLDAGLWPLLQLTILVPAALWAATRSLGRRA